MRAIKIAAFVLIVGGTLGLVYKGFTYNKDSHSAAVGPVGVSVSERKAVQIPLWGAIGAILVGSILLYVDRNKSCCT